MNTFHPANRRRRVDEAARIRSSTPMPVILADGCRVATEIITFHGLADGREHVALKLGQPSAFAPLVRIHSECLTGDAFGSARCDCGPQLDEALKRLAEQGGYLLYLRQEGRGIGLYRKLDAYVLQDDGHDTYAANRALGRGDDERDYSIGADMLKAMRITRITLLSNNPDKLNQLMDAGIDVIEQVPTGVFVGAHNRAYLEAKVRHAGHTIDLKSAVEAHE